MSSEWEKRQLLQPCSGINRPFLLCVVELYWIFAPPWFSKQQKYSYFPDSMNNWEAIPENPQNTHRWPHRYRLMRKYRAYWKQNVRHIDLLIWNLTIFYLKWNIHPWYIYSLFLSCFSSFETGLWIIHIVKFSTERYFLTSHSIELIRGMLLGKFHFKSSNGNNI